MLIDKRCPNCGATMQFETTMDSMFCPFCGGMVTNATNANEYHFDYQDTPSLNEPNLYISYNTVDPSVGMVTRIVSTGVKNTYINGQTLSFHLAQGPQTVVLKIGSKNYNRDIVIPSDNSPVRIYASYNGRAQIAIDQPEDSNTIDNILKDAINDGLGGTSANNTANIPAYNLNSQSVSSNTPKSTSNQNSTKSSSAAAGGGIGSIIFIIIAIFLMRSCLCDGCDSSSQTTRATTIITTTAAATTTVKSYFITINVEYEENLQSDKHDIVVVVDDKEAGKVDPGTIETISGNITEGKHTITFYEYGNESVDGTCEIEVTQPIIVNCKVYCSDTQVEIKEFDTSVIETDPLSGELVIGRKQRDGFNSNRNTKLKLADYDCEIPDYWNDDETQRIVNNTLERHVAKAENADSYVRLTYAVSDDPGSTEYELLIANEEAYTQAIAEGLGGSEYKLIRRETVNFGEANGFLIVLDETVEKNGNEYNTRVYAYLFSSQEQQKFIHIALVVSDNAKYEYTADFVKTLNSIKKHNGTSNDNPTATIESTSSSTTETSATATPKPTSTPTPVPTEAPKETTRYAFRSIAYDYTMYYIIDIEENHIGKKSF